ncbi:hypothetical protein AZH11_08660 [Pseudomonas simiae]|nr:hypothetical protein AZH11_08660 [Pseudomonas simiae]
MRTAPLLRLLNRRYLAVIPSLTQQFHRRDANCYKLIAMFIRLSSHRLYDPTHSFLIISRQTPELFNQIRFCRIKALTWWRGAVSRKHVARVNLVFRQCRNITKVQ